MSIKKLPILGFVLCLLLVAPALITPPSVKYKIDKQNHAWGDMYFRNTPLGAYKDDFVKHQLTVIVTPSSNKEQTCISNGVSFDITSNGGPTALKQSFSNIDNSQAPAWVSRSVLVFSARGRDRVELPLEVWVEFELGSGCVAPGIYKHGTTLKPEKEYHWLGNLIFNAFMGV